RFAFALVAWLWGPSAPTVHAQVSCSLTPSLPGCVAPYSASNRDGSICEVTATDPNQSEESGQLRTRIIVFVFVSDLSPARLQAGPDPTPTPPPLQAAYAFCSSLLGAGYVPSDEPLDNSSITGFTDLHHICAVFSQDYVIRVDVSAGGPSWYLPS